MQYLMMFLATMRIKMPIQAVIFDLFDVLLCEGDITVRSTYETGIGLPENGLLQAMFRSLQFREAIAGRVSETELWRDLAYSIGVDPQEWSKLAATFYSAIKLHTELVAFFRTLRPRYKTAILSNAPTTVRTLLTQDFHLDREVDRVIISSEERVMKPQSEIFRIAASRLGVQLQEVIFVDDELRFVEAAQSLGMVGIQFKDTKQTIAEIQFYLEHGTFEHL
jgi:HAD superfamily hydrolase (TIGR01509 family)